MKVKKEKSNRRYVPPPQFTPILKPAKQSSSDLWLIQLPPGADAKEFDGKKFKLKNNKVISMNETTELLVQKRGCGNVVTSEGPVPLQGQLTLRHKIEIPIKSKANPVPQAEEAPSDLKFRLSREHVTKEENPN